jgi:hypothetical protein
MSASPQSSDISDARPHFVFVPQTRTSPTRSMTLSVSCWRGKGAQSWCALQITKQDWSAPLRLSRRNLQDANGAVFVQLYKIGVKCPLHSLRNQSLTLTG